MGVRVSGGGQYNRSLERQRVFDEFEYRTKDSWSRIRRIIGKAEFSRRGPSPRSIVNSFTAKEWAARELYEDVDCARGERWRTGSRSSSRPLRPPR